MNRGVNGQHIFEDDKDRHYFSRTVARFKECYHIKLYHWAWMSNHYHALIEIPFNELRYFVSAIQQAYAQYHHARHDGAGIFWQGRFKSKPVELGSYLGSCGRYIERNPVRAGIAEKAEEFPWSSARFYVSNRPDSLTDHNKHLGDFTEDTRESYAKTLHSGIDDELMHGAMRRSVLGDDTFASSLQLRGGRYRPKRGHR
jgi:putative transposase